MGRIRESVTPYYQSLIQNKDNPLTDPLGLQVYPHPDEDVASPALNWDPLEEKKNSPVPGLIHRFPHIALLLVTSKCFSYCRFCFRADYLNHPAPSSIFDLWDPIEQYLRSHTEIREVLLSGGDPLMLSDADIDRLGHKIRDVSARMIIRVGTRAPVFAPSRFSDELLGVLESLKPLVMSIHVNHPREITPEFEAVVSQLVSRGIVCYSQTVLLKGVNDNASTLQMLFQTLYEKGVRPYYLHLCDRVQGTAHFMVTPQRATDLWRSLWGKISGMAIPHLVYDAASSQGKIPLQDQPTLRTEADAAWILREGKWIPYP